MLSIRTSHTRFILPALLAIMGGLLCAYLIPMEHEAVKQQLLGFPDSNIEAHRARPVILGILCFLPAIATLIHCFGNTMDRYLVRQFISIFLICFGALFSIWFLFDLNDNLTEFRESSNLFITIAKFYSYRSPAIILFLLPYALLLSLLYCLGKLSSDREITAMVQSGRSVTRITAPLILAGAFCSLLCLGLNYQWAPIAEGQKDNILNIARGRPTYEANNVMYRDVHTRRLWMVGAFPTKYEKGVPLENVQVTTTRADKSLAYQLSASRAYWNRKKKSWVFENPVIGTMEPGQPPVFVTPKGPIVVHGWEETPWQLIKPGLAAQYLGIPGLISWLQANGSQGFLDESAPYLTHLHYRVALPFACLVTVLLATPLAIHFSRRGPGSGVFFAVVLSALMLLISNIALAFGESGKIPPFIAAWLPNLLFTMLGLYFYHRRATGRPIYQSIRRLLPSSD